MTASLCRTSIRTQRLNSHDCPALLQRSLRPPEESEREDDGAEREIEDDEEVGEVSGRRGDELEGVENDDRTVGDLMVLQCQRVLRIEKNATYEREIFDERRSKRERIVANEEVPEERENEVL